MFVDSWQGTLNDTSFRYSFEIFLEIEQAAVNLVLDGDAVFNFEVTGKKFGLLIIGFEIMTDIFLQYCLLDR
jgi:hypothetical protein